MYYYFTLVWCTSLCTMPNPGYSSLCYKYCLMFRGSFLNINASILKCNFTLIYCRPVSIKRDNKQAVKQAKKLGTVSKWSHYGDLSGSYLLNCTKDIKIQQLSCKTRTHGNIIMCSFLFWKPTVFSVHSRAFLEYYSWEVCIKSH